MSYESDAITALAVSMAEDAARAFGYRVRDGEDPGFMMRGCQTADGHAFSVGPFVFIDEDLRGGWGVVVELASPRISDTVVHRDPSLDFITALGLSELACSVLQRTVWGAIDGYESEEEVAERFAAPAKTAIEQLRSLLHMTDT